MTHWLDRLALRAVDGGTPQPTAIPSTSAPATVAEAGSSRRDPVGLERAGTAAHMPLQRTSLPRLRNDRTFSRRAGLRTVGLAAGLLLAAPLTKLGPSVAASASVEDCTPTCLAAAERRYRDQSTTCNSGIPAPSDFLTGWSFMRPLCQLINYDVYVEDRRRCGVLEDCGRKKPPPPVPPPPTRGSPPPPPTGGCGFIGLTSCGDHCCPAGYLCAGSGCVPPPPPPAAECNPPCPAGKKCQKGQCVDVASDCGTCPPGAKCCSGCSFGAYCATADFECRCG